MNKIGEIFNNWTIIEKLPSKGSNAYVLCKCVCGIEKQICYGNLKRGFSKSCGCVNKAIFDDLELGIYKNERGRPIKLKEIDLTGLKKQFEYAKLRQSILDSGDSERIALMLAAEQSKPTPNALEDAQG